MFSGDGSLLLLFMLTGALLMMSSHSEGTTDDSRATAVELLHDGRRHPTRELKWPNMSRLVESALCVHIDVPILSQHDLSIAAKEG